MILPVPDEPAYTLYVDESLDRDKALEEYYHALHHIQHDDFADGDIQNIELSAHKNED